MNLVGTEFRLIGYVGVDSGQVMLTDPCYLADFTNDNLPVSTDDPSGKPTAPSYPYSYVGACHATLSAKQGGELGRSLGVATSTAYGDGRYPVYQIVTRSSFGETVAGLFVDFSGLMDEGYDDEDEDNDDEQMTDDD